MDSRTRLKRLQIQSQRLVDTFFSGDYRSIFKGPGLEFHENRPYVVGDDVRFIDWNVSSRMAGPYCKVFKEERELILTVLVDLSFSVTHGFDLKKKMMAEELLALLGFAAANNGDRVGVLAFSEGIDYISEAKRGKHHFLNQLNAILNLKTTSRGSNLQQALRHTREHMKRRGICVIISDFKTDGYWRELAMLSHKHDVVAIRLEDTLDSSFPKVGYLTLGDAEENLNMRLMTSSKKFQEDYKGYWETMRSAWRKNCQKRKVAPLIVHTNDDVVSVLFAFFKHRGR